MQAKWDALDALDNLQQRYMVPGASGKAVPANPGAIQQIEAVRNVVAKVDASPQSLRRLKQVFDESIAESGGFAGNDLTQKFTLKAQREASGAIREVLHQKFPDVADLDKEISFWLNVKGVVKATNQRLEGQQRIGPVVGGIIGAAGYKQEGVVGGLSGALAGAAGENVLMKAVRSPLWMSTSSILKDQVADLLAKGQIKQAAILAGRAVGVAAQAESDGVTVGASGSPYVEAKSKGD